MKSIAASSTKTIFEGVCKDLVVVLGLVGNVKVVAMSSFVKDFGADSLDKAVLTMALEDRFEIELTDHAWEKVDSVGQAVALIDRQLREAGRLMEHGLPVNGVADGGIDAYKGDWQIGHTEGDGKAFVIYDMALDDDASACTVTVKGRGAQETAERLVKLLRV
jgi:acyl carrier protein